MDKGCYFCGNERNTSEAVITGCDGNKVTTHVCNGPCNGQYDVESFRDQY